MMKFSLVFSVVLIVFIMADVCCGMRYSAKREGLHKCVVRVTCKNGGGTGAVVKHRNGIVVVTAAHVIGNSQEITLSDGMRTVTATVLGRNSRYDIVVLISKDIEMLDIVAAPMYEGKLKVGDIIQQCGYGGRQYKATKGKIQFINGSQIRCSGEIIGGDSGSPIFIGSAIAGISTGITGKYRGLLFRRFVPSKKPAFLGTASVVILAIMYAKPVVEKMIKLIRGWRAYRQPAFPLFPKAWWNKNSSPEVEPKPEPDDVVVAPPIPESFKIIPLIPIKVTPLIPDKVIPPISNVIASVTNSPSVGQLSTLAMAGLLPWDWVFIGPLAGILLFGTAAVVLVLTIIVKYKGTLT